MWWWASRLRTTNSFLADIGVVINLTRYGSGITEHHAIRWGTFGNVRTSLSRPSLMNGMKPLTQPFAWTKIADQVLKKAHAKNFNRACVAHSSSD